MSNRLNKRSLILIPFILVASLLLVPAIPPAHAATGLVCITASSSATSCPGSPPTIPNQAAGTTLTIGVFVQASDDMGGFDIYVKSDNTVLNPTSAAFGGLIVSPSLSVICVNGSPQPGSGACTTGTANGPGVVEVQTLEASGQNECLGQPTCSGMAFTITYTVQSGGASGTTVINYPKAPGCASSTSDPTDCVLIFDNFGTVLSENIQTGTYGAAAAVTTLVSVVNGNDGNLYWSPFQGTSWGPWQPLNGQSPSSPTLCVSSSTTAELLVRGVDNQVYHKTFNSGTNSWSATWDHSPAGGLTIDAPACAVLGTTLYVVVRGGANDLWATTFTLPSGPWGPSWTNLAGSTPNAPALVATSSASRLDLIVRGTDNGIYHKAFTSGAWAAAWDSSNRTPVPDRTFATPAIVSDGTQLHIVVVGADYRLYYATLSFPGVWSTYTNLLGSSPVTPALVIDSANTLHLVVQGFDNQIYAKAKTSGGSWDATWSNGNGIIRGTPGVVISGSSVSVVATGLDSRLWYNTQTSGTWGTWVNMNGAASISPGLSTP